MEKEWYVVNTYSGHESKVKEKLEMRAESMGMQDYIFRVIVPETTEVEVKESVDDMLFDESVLAPTLDEMLFDESTLVTPKTGLDAVLLDETFLEEAEVPEDDAEEELIDTVEDNDQNVEDLEYEVGDDDILLDDLLN